MFRKSIISGAPRRAVSAILAGQKELVVSQSFWIASASDETEIFDAEAAMNRACDDLDLLQELSDLFAEHREKMLAQLTTAVETGDAKGIGEAAHALKGSIGTFSTKLPFLLARELEFCGKEGRLEQTPELLGALKSALIELEAAVRNFLSANRK